MPTQGLPLPTPPGGGSSLAPVGKKNELNLDSILPLLLMVSPLIEARNPGSGLGLAAGITAYQKGKQQKRQQEFSTLLGMAVETDDDQEATWIGALTDAGYDPKILKAVWQASRGMVDPGRKTERALNALVEDPKLGLIPRKTQIEVQARGQEREQELAQREKERTEDLATEEQRFGQQQRATLAGQTRSLLVQISLDPRATPQAQGRARVLLTQLQQGRDPQEVMAEIPTLAGELAQPTPKAPEQSEITARILDKIARGEKLTPGEQRIYNQVIKKQDAAGGGLSLSDAKLAAFLGQIDPNKLSDEQRELIGLSPKKRVQVVTPPNRQQAAERLRQIVALKNKILALSKAGKFTAEQEIKYQKELEELKAEYDRLLSWLRMPGGR